MPDETRNEPSTDASLDATASNGILRFAIAYAAVTGMLLLALGPICWYSLSLDVAAEPAWYTPYTFPLKEPVDGTVRGYSADHVP